jgi:hypothetical protein
VYTVLWLVVGMTRGGHRRVTSTLLRLHQQNLEQAMAGAAAELADIGGPHCPPHDDPEADEQAGHHWEHCKTEGEKGNWKWDY